MAHSGRDTVNSREQPYSNRSTSTGGRSDKPLFEPRERTRKYFTGANTNATKAGEQDEQRLSTLQRSGSSGNWMNGRTTRRLGLEEAFHKTDENASVQRRQSQTVAGRGSARAENPAARRASYSPGMTPTPPRTLTAAFKMADSEERSASVPIESQRLQRRALDGSPSPAARVRPSSRGSDEKRFQQLKNSEPLDLGRGRGSPLSRRASVVEDDNNTVASSEGSFSGLSLVEDPTDDDFDEKMKQYARDQARVDSLSRMRTGPFSRADVAKATGSPNRTVKGSSTTSLEHSEPPTKPPRTWGSKAKKLPGFLSKVLSPDSSVELKDQEQAQNASLAASSLAADVPIPSVEHESIQPTPPSSRPASAQPNFTSPEKSAPWQADLDFTAQSIMMSPQLRLRSSSKIDQIRDREIQDLAKSAIASRALEEIRERNSAERSRSNSPEIVRKPSIDKMANSPAAKQRKSNSAAPDFVHEPGYAHEKTILEEEGEAIPGTPITVFTGSSINANNNINNQKTSSDRNSERRSSEYKRDQSRDVLRRLSRAASKSPSPLSSENTVDQKPEASSEPAEERPLKPKPQSTLRLEQLSEDSAKRLSSGSVDPEERIAAEAKLFDLDNKSERDSTRGPSPAVSDDEAKVDVTPRPKVDPMSLPTPKVTGAFIDTPAPTARELRRQARDLSPTVKAEEKDAVDKKPVARESRLDKKDSELSHRERQPYRNREKRSQSQPEKQKERPPLINTAKPHRVSEDLRRIKLESQVDDSTLDDFDAILAADFKITDEANDTTIFDAMLDLEHDDKGRLLSDREKQRRLETLALERMSKSLKRTSVSIRDAKRGIEGLEDQVTSITTETPITTHSHTHCSTCATSSPTYHLSIPVPRLWYRHPSSSRRKMTWLGLIITMLLSWYISESIMCDLYCHPTVSSVNTWSPWDPFFPYAIPSKLDHWTGRKVSGAAYEVYRVWTDGKEGRPRWAGPAPRPLNLEPVHPIRYDSMVEARRTATQGSPKAESKEQKSNFWGWDSSARSQKSQVDDSEESSMFEDEMIW
ncbi:hypothetical protein BP5796_00253 [Coleophoma crateriformis]|uniref:Uncharacterized protein n=1 Tax=Coleophoma crateriformis TaxID=565419 RepID=A0A3D8T7H5_9HELO|nr:hypothetical protein BP5796_00253 [Coleophoma crateriformis]